VLSILRRDSYPLALLTAGHFLIDFYNNFLPLLIPVLIASLKISLTSAGLLVMISSFSSSLVQPGIGYLIDKRGLSWLILVCLPIGGLFICLLGMSPSYPVAVICALFAGLGCSIFHPLGTSLVSRITPPDRKGLAMAVFISGGNIGFALAPATVIFFLLNFGVASLPWLIFPSVLLALAYYFYGLHHVPMAVMRTVARTASTTWYKSVSLLKLNAVMGMRSWAQMALPSFLPVWLAQQGHSQALAGSLLTVYLVASAAGSVFGGWLGDKVGRKNCITALLTLSLPTMFLFYHSTELNLFAWVMLAISGLALQGTLPSSIVWAQDIIPGNAAMASGMMFGLSFGLGGVGVAITGALADTIGLQAALLWSLLPLIIAIPLTLAIKEKHPIAATE